MRSRLHPAGEPGTQLRTTVHPGPQDGNPALRRHGQSAQETEQAVQGHEHNVGQAGCTRGGHAGTSPPYFLANNLTEILSRS